MSKAVSLQENSHEDTARAFCEVYGLFAAAFRYPDSEQLALIRDGVLSEDLKDTLMQAAPELGADVNWRLLKDVDEEDALQLEYTRLFVSGAGCYLNGGLYCGPRMKTMEDAVRFYNHFGFTLPEGSAELPDHITTELEFLQILCFSEAQLLVGGAQTEHYCRARRDFIGRHPGRWLPQLQEHLKKQQAMSYFGALVEILVKLLACDYDNLLRQVGKAMEQDAGGDIPFTELKV